MNFTTVQNYECPRSMSFLYRLHTFTLGISQFHVKKYIFCKNKVLYLCNSKSENFQNQKVFINHKKNVKFGHSKLELSYVCSYLLWCLTFFELIEIYFILQLSKKTKELNKACEKHYQLEQELAFYKIDSKFDSLGKSPPRFHNDVRKILHQNYWSMDISNSIWIATAKKKIFKIKRSLLIIKKMWNLVIANLSYLMDLVSVLKTSPLYHSREKTLCS
jgi:hypothetical protein